MLDIPDYPLGMTGADMGTTAQQGPLAIYKTVAPTYDRHGIEGQDMVVTSDGTVWVLFTLNTGIVGSYPNHWIGPVLMKWDGATWTIINDDIEGLGVKRAQRGAAGHGVYGPAGVALATDGTDLWLAYGVADGTGPEGGDNMAIRVKKYSVGGATFSNVGSVVSGNTTRVTFNARAGHPDTCPMLQISPGGVLWLSFWDAYDVATGFINTLGAGQARRGTCSSSCARR